MDEEIIKELQALANTHSLPQATGSPLWKTLTEIISLTESYPNGFTEGIIGGLTYNINQLDENLRAPFEEIRSRLTPLPPREFSLKEKNFYLTEFLGAEPLELQPILDQ